MTTPHSKTHSSPITDRAQIYKQGWHHGKEHVRKYSRLILIIIIVNIVNGAFDPESRAALSPNMEVLATILSIMLSLASARLSMGLINITLKLLDKHHVSFSDGLVDFKKAAKAFVAGIIGAIGILLGLAVFIIPGIIVQVRLIFVSTLILDKDMGIWEAIVASWRMTKGSVWNLFMISFVVQFIQILGILTLGIGLFWTLPFMMSAQTLAYRALRDHK